MKEKITITENIKHLLSGYLSDSLNPDDLAMLKNWIDESPAHKKYFNEMRHVWALSGQDTPLSDKTGKLPELRRSTLHQNGKKFWTWQKIAASWVILIICAGAFGWHLHDKHPAKTEMAATSKTTVQARLGSQSTVDLPDGTRVWLNGGSRLTYNGSYGKEDREVALTGEACFDVTTNPEKPFVVKAGSLSIKAFGTTFNVKAYPEDKAITTTLVKGKVTIEGKDENNDLFSIVMKPNENVTCLTENKLENKPGESSKTHSATEVSSYISEPIIIENDIKPELYTSWKDDLWVIEKQKLGDLSKDFERRYNVRIEFNSEEVANYHFSGTIQRETIEQVMKILRRTIPLHYSFNKNLITISEDQNLTKEFNLKNK